MAAPTLRVLGTGTANPTATTAINPTVGTGATADDLSVLSVVMKPYSTTITTPSGWTKIGEWTNGTVASAADVGSTKLALFYKIGAAVGAIGNLTLTGADTAAAGIVTYQNTTGQWDVSAFTNGSDTTDGTAWSTTGAAGLNLNYLTDIVFTALAMNSDVGTISAPTFNGMTGMTQQTQSGAFNAVNSQGNDCRLYARYVNFSAGTSNVAPGFTLTNTSNVSGTQAFLRVREATANTVTGAVTFGAGSAAGTAAHAGSAAGTVAFTGAAAGARTSAGTASGAVAFGAGSAVGGNPKSGTVSGTVTFGAGAAAGKAVTNGTAAGTVTFGAGSASGTRANAYWSESLLADWDADDIQGADGASISSWTDKIASYAAVQGTGTAQPTLRDRAHGLNNHQVLEFDGGTDWMALPAGARALAQNASTLDVFVVFTMPSGAVTGTRTLFSLSTGTSTASARVSVQARNASGNPAAAGRRLDTDASVAQAAGSAALSNPYAGVLTARYLWNSSDAYLYQDGTQVGSNLSFQTSGVTDNTVSLNGAIGARPEGTIERHNGTIARVLVFPDLSSGRRALVHSYLATRYGFTASDYVNTGAGQVLGTVTFTGTVAGVHPSKGTAAGTVSWTGAAAGTRESRGSAAGTVSFGAGSAAGKRTPKGSITGAVSWSGTASGQRASAGSAAGIVLFSGSAAGAHVSRGTVGGALTYTHTAAGISSYQGSAAGTVSWTGFALSGNQTAGAAAGTIAFTHTVTGRSAYQGSTTGTFTYTGTTSGQRASRGSGTGAVSWNGAASGGTDQSGSAAGTFTFTGSAAGVYEPLGAAQDGEFTFVGSAFGLAPVVGQNTGSAEGSFNFVGTAVGAAPVGAGNTGSASGAVVWVGSARGPVRPMGPLQIGRPTVGGPSIGRPTTGGPRVFRPRSDGDLITVGWPRKETDV